MFSGKDTLFLQSKIVICVCTEDKKNIKKNAAHVQIFFKFYFYHTMLKNQKTFLNKEV